MQAEAVEVHAAGGLLTGLRLRHLERPYLASAPRPKGNAVAARLSLQLFRRFIALPCFEYRRAGLLRQVAATDALALLQQIWRFSFADSPLAEQSFGAIWWLAFAALLQAHLQYVTSQA